MLGAAGGGRAAGGEKKPITTTTTLLLTQTRPSISWCPSKHNKVTAELLRLTSQVSKEGSSQIIAYSTL